MTAKRQRELLRAVEKVHELLEDSLPGQMLCGLFARTDYYYWFKEVLSVHCEYPMFPFFGGRHFENGNNRHNARKLWLAFLETLLLDGMDPATDFQPGGAA